LEDYPLDQAPKSCGVQDQGAKIRGWGNTFELGIVRDPKEELGVEAGFVQTGGRGLSLSEEELDASLAWLRCKGRSINTWRRSFVTFGRVVMG
jgi:hypothetical protein